MHDIITIKGVMVAFRDRAGRLIILDDKLIALLQEV